MRAMNSRAFHTVAVIDAAITRLTVQAKLYTQRHTKNNKNQSNLAKGGIASFGFTRWQHKTDKVRPPKSSPDGQGPT